MPRYEFYAEAIHASWPAYPAGHGPEAALESLCCFPGDTHFIAIDDIDQCMLFLAWEQTAQKEVDRFSERHFHVAIWHDDLRELRDRQWVEGVQDEDEMECGELSFRVVVNSEGLSVSGAGWDALPSRISEEELSPALATRVNSLVAVGALDAAVREAAVTVEVSLRTRLGIGSEFFGSRLIKLYVNHITKAYGGPGAFQLHVRTELRTFFKFVRNEFAHNFVQLSPARCRALLLRASTLLEMLDHADQGIGSFQDTITLSHLKK